MSASVTEAVKAVREDTAPLAGRTALVTGGSRGLGREIAIAFAAAGADVAVASRKKDACAALAETSPTMTTLMLPPT